MLKVFVGWDPDEVAAYQVCVASLAGRSSLRLEVQPLLQPHLRALGLYWRPQERRGGQLWDSISGAPMATDFALTRFLVPHLAGYGGWALFCDCDFLWRADLAELLALADPRHAVMLVKHDHKPPEERKMDGRAQLPYRRKNWSSLVLWNCCHKANRALTPALVSAWPGRNLHGFAWLDDHLIGALPEAWNWLEGWSDPAIDPKAVHFTRGTPDMPGYQAVPYADDWRAVLAEVNGGPKVPQPRKANPAAQSKAGSD